jgi:nicotinate-nucleotide adenylyltransferase
MRIGVFGGTFDPVHVGHLIVAECCREQARLDRVLFVPASVSPHKLGSPPATAGHRLEMLRLATGGHDAFAVSTLEVDRGGVSFTADTLASLHAAYPDDRLFLVLGPDGLAGLDRWHEPRQVLATAEILAVERTGLDDTAAMVSAPPLAALLGATAAAVVANRVRVPAIGIRASDLRAAVAAGGSIRYRTPRAVERYIESHGLYRGQ